MIKCVTKCLGGARNMIKCVTLILGCVRKLVALAYLGCAMEPQTSENGFKDFIYTVYPLHPCSYPALIGTLLSARNQTSQLSES